jgi:adhesin transport system outer membrane protein
MLRALAVAAALSMVPSVVVPGVVLANGPMSLDEAIRRAVATNPRVGEAAANRRAVDQELRQVQGALLPQVRLTAAYGSERFRQTNTIDNSTSWRPAGGEAGVVVRQLLFDGGTALNEIYRQMARSDAAAWRTQERSELVALDVAEAYLEILRFEVSLADARRNVQAHLRYLNNVESRFSGGRAGVGDVQQVRERLASARAVEAELRIRLEDAKAAYRRHVGAEPVRLRFPARLSGMPASRSAALQLTVQNNTSLLAAQSDVRAAQRQFDAALGAYGPTVAFELRNSNGRDSSQNIGSFDETSAKVVASWNIFDGGANVARRGELAERVGENQMRLSALQRAAFESIDRAWSVRENSGLRITSLQQQVRAAEQVVVAYRSEYELGQRTLLDLLNAENAVFNARLSLAAARSVAVFSDYQLMAATGALLARVSAPILREARPTPASERSVLPSLNLRDPALGR